MKSFIQHFKQNNWIQLMFVLFLVVILILLAYSSFGMILLTVLMSYVLNGPFSLMVRCRIYPLLSALICITLTYCLMAIIFLVLLPILSSQAINFSNQLPDIIDFIKQGYIIIYNHFDTFLDKNLIDRSLDSIHQQVVEHSTLGLTFAYTTLQTVSTMVIYMIVVPIMVFFLLKDKEMLLDWMQSFFPRNNSLMVNLFSGMNYKLGVYFKGKFLEMLIMACVTCVFYSTMHLNYAILLSVIAGLTCFIPLIGIIIITIPVMLVGIYQFGIGGHLFVILMIGHFLIMLLDGNILVPMLFSSTMNLHPVAILFGIVFFGQLAGFWGVFFAIPLLTCMNMLLNACPFYNLGEYDDKSK
jgi:putative permease